MGLPCPNRPMNASAAMTTMTTAATKTVTITAVLLRCILLLPPAGYAGTWRQPVPPKTLFNPQRQCPNRTDNRWRYVTEPTAPLSAISSYLRPEDALIQGVFHN